MLFMLKATVAVVFVRGRHFLARGVQGLGPRRQGVVLPPCRPRSCSGVVVYAAAAAVIGRTVPVAVKTVACPEDSCCVWIVRIAAATSSERRLDERDDLFLVLVFLRVRGHVGELPQKSAREGCCRQRLLRLLLLLLLRAVLLSVKLSGYA